MKIFTELKIARTACGLKQFHLANLIGVAQSSYAMKENGHVPFTIEEGMKIHKELNRILELKGRPSISMEELFKR